MKEKQWIGFVDSSEADAAPQIKVTKSSKHLVTRDMRDEGERITVTVRYTTSGAWEGTVNEFQTVEIPETTLIETEGAPAIPNKDGVFVAIPTDAEDVQIRTVDKSFYSIDHDLRILPAPKQFTEEEFQEVYEPDSAIYESDEPYPGRDFDFLGIKQIAGIKVVHILAYLGQYKPMSRRLDLIQSLEGTLQNSLPSRLTAGKLGPVQR